MGPIPIDRIISVSSEEQTHKAENILNISDTNQTWRCKSGEKQATVILQLLKPSIISSIDIGNENSAFVEVLVGKSTSEDYQVLLVTSSLMSLHECKNGLNVNKVRFFDTTQLLDTCKESWDRVKIVCTQPYIKLAKYGLSFVRFHSKDIPHVEEKGEPIQLGSFFLRNDDEVDDLSSAGRLFAKRHEYRKVVTMPESIMNRFLPHQKLMLVQRSASKPKQKNYKKKDLTISPSNPSTSKGVINSYVGKINLETMNASKPKKRDSATLPSNQSTSTASTVTKRKESPTLSESFKKKCKLIKTSLPKTKPFKELLSDVVFTMSGYENPYRSNIRSKALEMGAAYKLNWDPSCTHLICAFINTPKYKQAKDHGVNRIVISDWIDKCYSNRCRFPWRRFALDKLEQDESESENEIFELVDTEKTSDSDDEWNISMSNNQPGPSTSRPSTSTQQPTSVYDVDTDIDSDLDSPHYVLVDENADHLPPLDNIFDGCSFYLSSSLEPILRQQCRRYILSQEGTLNTIDKCDYVVSVDPNDTKLKNYVPPQWIWDCYEAEKILPLE